jgi:hypothetical protein
MTAALRPHLAQRNPSSGSRSAVTVAAQARLCIHANAPLWRLMPARLSYAHLNVVGSGDLKPNR